MKHYPPNKPKNESQSASTPKEESLLTNTPPASSSKTTSKKNKTKLIIASVILILVGALFAVVIYFIVLINSPKNSKNANQVNFKVEANTGIDTIATNLLNQGLIADKNLFILYAKLGPSRGNLKPGVYLLSPSMSLAKIADTIGSGKIATKKVTFQEGLTIEEMARKWAREGFGTAQSFVDASKLSGTYNQPFLQYRSNKASLEGYLYPATYDILLLTPPQDQINKMLDSFASQVLPKLDKSVVNSSKLNEIVTLASIVEKEANTTEDRKLVAGVFYNRLNIGMKLESDVTVNYATGKSETSASDVKVISPYNTYIVSGLPLGPICNPSLDAILATANPTPSDYYYFIADRDGVVRYAKTYQEHQQNIEKYLN